MTFSPEHCTICPRRCGANRVITTGRCGCGTEMHIARADLHFWEEPCISGKTGSGTVFFSGCALQCCFCQNQEISRHAVGRAVSTRQLADIFLQLQEKQACNINLVTGSHFTPWIVEALDLVRSQLTIPVVWNCSGYESPEILQMLNGYVDIYLPDLKYLHTETASAYSACPDYFTAASSAIPAMLKQVGALQWNGDLLQRGVIIRHLVLPKHRKESMKLLDWLAQTLPKEQFLLSLMGQYTPPKSPLPYRNLNRRITTMEYEQVRERAVQLGLDGFAQDRTAASGNFIPDFQV